MLLTACLLGIVLLRLGQRADVVVSSLRVTLDGSTQTATKSTATVTSSSPLQDGATRGGLAANPLITQRRGPKMCPPGTCNEGGGDCLVGQCICKKGFSGATCAIGKAPDCVAHPIVSREYALCAYFDEAYGLIHATAATWTETQKRELNHWLSQPHLTGDRIEQHVGWFQNYAALKDLITSGKHKLGRMMETGCGPWTQSLSTLKAIKMERQYTSLTLVGPLMDRYIAKVKWVPYRDEKTDNVFVVKSGAEDALWLLRDETYDTVVMLNVIEHGVNSVQFLRALYQKLKPRGVLVLHEYYYDQYGFKWENGHPLKSFKKLYDQFLANFQVVFRRDFDNEGDYAALKYSGFYFIGIKPEV